MTRRVLAFASVVALLALPACGAPDYVVRYQVGGAQVDGETVWFPAVRSRHQEHDAAYVVSCSRRGSNSAWPQTCRWVAAGEPGGAVSGEDRRLAAMAAAGIDHGCALGEIAVQSTGTGGDEGYWLLTCGTQRYYRWSEQRGRFIEIAQEASEGP